MRRPLNGWSRREAPVQCFLSLTTVCACGLVCESVCFGCVRCFGCVVCGGVRVLRRLWFRVALHSVAQVSFADPQEAAQAERAAAAAAAKANRENASTLLVLTLPTVDLCLRCVACRACCVVLHALVWATTVWVVDVVLSCVVCPCCFPSLTWTLLWQRTAPSFVFEPCNFGARMAGAVDCWHRARSPPCLTAVFWLSARR